MKHYGGYRKTYTFGYTCLIYHATTLFCRRFYSYKNDPLGKTAGQMVGAARSARQNQVEASARAAFSDKQEVLQLDVARGSLDELAGDYEAFIIDSGEIPWSDTDPRSQQLLSLKLDKFESDSDLLHDFGVYIQSMRVRFAEWLENPDPLIAANSILRILNRTMGLLHNQMEADYVQQDASADSDTCPKCGGKLRPRTSSSGRRFLGCSNYPSCTFTRSLDRE